MLTFQHGFWIYFFTRRSPHVWQFVLGSMLPDYVYFILIGVLWAKGQLHLDELIHLSPTTFMTYIPLYPWVVQTDLIGHSVIFWGVGFLLTFLPWLRRFQAFSIGWGSHLLVDELTHAAHANFFFYPLTLWAIHSPVSYWEPDYFAREFKLVNGTLIGLVTVYLLIHWWRKKRNEG